MDHIARSQDFSDAPSLTCAEPTKGNEFDLGFLCFCLTRCLHAWASIVNGQDLITEARAYY